MVYAPYALRLTGSHPTASLETIPPSETGNFSVVSVSNNDINCDASVVDAGVPIPTEISVETEVFLCFQVTAGAGLEQGETTTATWRFNASSAE